MLDDISISKIVSGTIHLFAAIMAVGGAWFIRRAVRLSSQSPNTSDDDNKMLDSLIKRSTILIYASIGLVLATGIWNMVIAFPQHATQPIYHMLFGFKVLLGLALLGIAIGMTGREPILPFLRKRTRLWIGVAMLIAVAVVLLSKILAQLPRTDVAKELPPQSIAAPHDDSGPE